MNKRNLYDTHGITLRNKPKKKSFSVRCILGIHKYEISNPNDIKQPNSSNPITGILTAFLTTPLIPFIVQYKCIRCGKSKSKTIGQQ